MKFLKDYFFYRVSAEEKQKVKEKIMDDDHKGYITLVCIIFVFQLIMLASNLYMYGFEPKKISSLGYRYLYIALMALVAVMLVITNYFYKHRNTTAYFVMISLTMVSVLLWGAGISVFDSSYGIDLTTYAYVTFSAVAFMLLEPWIVAINLISVTALLNILLRFTEFTYVYYGFGTVINSASICVLAIMVSTFTFTRRIRSLKLEMEVASLNQTLAQKAYVDDLTGLNSRHYLTEHINDPLNLGFAPSGVMMMDLDHFKNVNDTFGHQNGDICLKCFGEVIREFMQDKNGYAVRYGGEEFLIYIEHTDFPHLFELAEELRKKVQEKDISLLDGSHINITISIGLALAVNGLTYSAMIDKADQALYRAKETKNAVSE